MASPTQRTDTETGEVITVTSVQYTHRHTLSPSLPLFHHTLSTTQESASLWPCDKTRAKDTTDARVGSNSQQAPQRFAISSVRRTLWSAQSLSVSQQAVVVWCFIRARVSVYMFSSADANTHITRTHRLHW